MGKIFTPFSKEDLMPKEEMLAVSTQKGKLQIGIPKESHFQERCVALTPDAVEVLVKNGHHILVETGAGEGANFTDNQYSEAGAEIAYDTKKVFAQPVVIKIIPPTEKEIGFMQAQSILISSIMPNTLQKRYFEKLAAKKITAIGAEFLQDEHGTFPVKRLLSEITGTTAVLLAGELLATPNNGNGTMLGGIAGVRPTEIVIFGSGSIAEYAARAATGLGASVRIFDSAITNLRQLQIDLNQRIPTSTLDPKEIRKALMRCDVAIGAIECDKRTPSIVPEELVSQMKAGAVIIESNMGNGSCFDSMELTTHESPTFTKYDVVHYGVANIASRYARTTSKALSNFFIEYLIKIAKDGGFEKLISQQRGLQSAIYLFKGRHTHPEIAERFNFPYTNLSLFII
uniref:alanine dehydrogenase n=1 Tax=Ornithobacterium rhinotracheale TaxID=28251 RepID=UPI0039A51C84